MRPVKIKDENADFAKPVDWDESVHGRCGNLSVRREVVGAGASARVSMFSNWRPSSDELMVLNAGGCVEIECCHVQPAMSVAAVPCADPDAAGPEIDVAYLRNVLADQFERVGEAALARRTRDGTDNSHGGEAALRALCQVMNVWTCGSQRCVAKANKTCSHPEFCRGAQTSC